MKSYCKYHRRWEPVEEFEVREDRAGYYAWCKQAMDEQGRSVNYPAIEDRGYGKCR
jgi:hypothetical protein